MFTNKKHNGAHVGGGGLSGVLQAMVPGAKIDKNTNKIVVHTGVSNDTVTFNIGGMLFETYRTTLKGVPRSALADDAFLQRHFRPDRKDHFFDRDPEIFHCILNYMRSGELHLPTTVCGPVVRSELEFWGIEEVDIEECCWSRYSHWATTLRDLKKLEDDRKSSSQLDDLHIVPRGCLATCFRGMWLLFTEPSSSRVAWVFSYISLSFVVCSIFSFCAQTHEVFRVIEENRVLNQTAVDIMNNISHVNGSANITTNTLDSSGHFPDEFYTTESTDVPHHVLYWMDIVCFVFFVLELFLRLISAPRKCRFIKQPMFFVEVLVLLPDVVEWTAKIFDQNDHKFIHVFEFLRILRVLRVFRLMKHFTALWILFYTLKASMKDLLLLLLFVMVGMLTFSSLIYFAETDAQESFSSIPKCFWWAVVTMTTVGYGDMFPVTGWGYLVGAATGISGVLMIGFTIPVLVNNFVMYYQYTQSAKYRKERQEFSGRYKHDTMKGHYNGNGSKTENIELIPKNEIQMHNTEMSTLHSTTEEAPEGVQKVYPSIPDYQEIKLEEVDLENNSGPGNGIKREGDNNNVPSDGINGIYKPAVGTV